MSAVRAVDFLGGSAGVPPTAATGPGLCIEGIGKHGRHHETHTHAHTSTGFSGGFSRLLHGHGCLHFYESIQILKFRTMKLQGSQENGFVQATENDERVTRIGRFLRKTSLDELPQLFNILKGEMSLVGPRPHPLELNQEFKSRIPKYMLRHKVKPGITGWAQVNGYRGQTETPEKMALRIEHDLWYIQNWSLWLDLKILLMTPLVMIHRNAY